MSLLEKKQRSNLLLRGSYGGMVKQSAGRCSKKQMGQEEAEISQQQICSHTLTLKVSSPSFASPAPTPADWPEADALITRQTLSERSELGCPPKSRVRPLRLGQAGRHWFWLLLPEQKWLACRGETRQHRTSRGHERGENACNAFTCPQDLLGSQVS
jgi:hypothetical protein